MRLDISKEKATEFKVKCLSTTSRWNLPKDHFLKKFCFVSYMLLVYLLLNKKKKPN